MENLDQTYKRLLSENKKEEKCKGCGEPISKCSCNTVEEAAETKKKPSWLISAEKRAEKKEGKVVKEGSSDVPFDMPYTTVKKTVTDKSGAKHGPMSRARDLARSALNKHLNATYNEYNPEKDKLKKQHFGMAEEVEQIDEISKATVGSYIKKASSDATISRKIATDFEHRAKRAKTQDMKDANGRIASDYKSKSWKRQDNINKAVDRLTKEEVQIDEANHREFASQGKMHPDMAKHMDVGSHMDYYEPKTGDKVHGKVMHKSDTEVHMKQTHDSYNPKKVGTVHKFAVTSKLDEQIDEVLKPIMGAGAYIDDFLKSKNPKFAGKSADKRRQMALAAYYAAKKGMREEVDLNEGTADEIGDKIDNAKSTEHAKSIISKTPTKHLQYLHHWNMGLSGARTHKDMPHIKAELHKRKSMLSDTESAKRFDEEIELDEGDLTVRTLYNKFANAHVNGHDTKSTEKVIRKVHGDEVMGHMKKAAKANAKADMDGEDRHFDNAQTAAKKTDRIGGTVGRGRSEFMRKRREWSEEVELDESEQKATPTVKTDKYSWGTMKTIHHGSSFSIPLHPEHHEHIAQMKDQQQHTIKTEDGKQYHVKREGDTVHFHGVNGGNKTSVPHKSLAEETQVDEAWVLRQKKKEKKPVKEENMISFKDFITEMEYDKNGRYVHKGKYGTSYDDPEGKEDSEKSTEKAEKRGRGRPAGAKSGARQIGGASKKGSGVEYTGYKLHLPNSNK